MTARKDKHGKYHNVLDQPMLGMEQAEDIKAKLFGTTSRKAVAGIRKVAKATERLEPLGDIDDGD